MSYRADMFYREDLEIEFEDRRRFPRIDASIETIYESQERILFNDLEDLTLRGAFIRTFVPDPTGTQAKLRMSLPGSNGFVTCLVRVVWSSKDREPSEVNGMGIKFLDLDSKDLMKLADFLLDKFGTDRAMDLLGAVRGAA
ncbi:MAG: PilZ domain-containing protein [Deltaproteobacteria bacterium]|nr:PilZ domain-containing protein [Deltaproteobacteria bacterium]